MGYQSEFRIVMPDNELEAIRRRKLRQLKRRLNAKQEQTEETDADKTLNNKQMDADEILKKIFKGRAWEVFNSARSQYPKAMDRIKDVLVKLASSGKLNEVTGEELYLFLRKMGLRVRLKTTIRVIDHGKFKSFNEKIKEDLKNF